MLVLTSDSPVIETESALMMMEPNKFLLSSASKISSELPVASGLRSFSMRLYSLMLTVPVASNKIFPACLSAPPAKFPGVSQVEGVPSPAQT